MKGKRQPRRSVARTGSKKRPATRRHRQKAQVGSRLTPDVQWALATRVYTDFDALAAGVRDERWIECAIAAYRAGNPLHLPRLAAVCMEADLPPPPWLSAVLAHFLPLAARGEPIRMKGETGRHARVLQAASSRVMAVETLLHFEAWRALLSPADHPNTETRYTLPPLSPRRRASFRSLLGERDRGRRGATKLAYRLAADFFTANARSFSLDPVTEVFHARTKPVASGGLLPRSERTIKEHVRRARLLLRDEKMRSFLAGNFPPTVLERLAEPDKKHQ